MNEKMELIINVLRRRANSRKIFAYFAILGVVIILLGGLYIFIFESPKIAAKDMEQQRKLGSSDNAITGLASLILNIQKNKEELNRENSILNAYQRVINKDGNEGFGFEIVKYYKRNFDRETMYPNQSDTDFGSIKKVLTDMKESNSYFSSEQAKQVFIQDMVDSLASLKKRLKEIEISNKNLRARHQELLAENLDIGGNDAMRNIEEQIAKDIIFKQDTSTQIKDISDKLDNGFYLKNAEETLREYQKVNDTAAKTLISYRDKMEANLKSVKDNYDEQETIVEDLRSKEAKLAAQKQLTSSSSSNDRSIEKNSKTIFYISTNIARFGIIVITIFFAQIFLSIYRYSIKVSDFYNARADALEIITQTELFGPDEISNLIEPISNILTPDKIDFGKSPQIATSEALKIVQSTLKKT